MSIILGISGGYTGGATGSGDYVRATSPTLVTPTLGAASATSIDFGGTALANYLESTPVDFTDQSGAGLTLTTNYFRATRVGRDIHVIAHITYPATADGSNNTIGGLPVAATGLTQRGFARLGDGTAVHMVINSGATTMTLVADASLSPLTNAQLSTLQIYLNFTYVV